MHFVCRDKRKRYVERSRRGIKSHVRSSRLFVSALKEKIGLIWHNIFNWLQQSIFGCVNLLKSYAGIMDTEKKNVSDYS